MQSAEAAGTKSRGMPFPLCQRGAWGLLPVSPRAEPLGASYLIKSGREYMASLSLQRGERGGAPQIDQTGADPTLGACSTAKSFGSELRQCHIGTSAAHAQVRQRREAMQPKGPVSCRGITISRPPQFLFHVFHPFRGYFAGVAHD